MLQFKKCLLAVAVISSMAIAMECQAGLPRFVFGKEPVAHHNMAAAKKKAATQYYYRPTTTSYNSAYRAMPSRQIASNGATYYR